MRGAFAHEDFSRGEEIAHAVTHGLGVLGSIAGLVVLVVRSAATGDARLIVGASVFGTAMVVLYTASTMYHALTAKRAKRVFELLDHGAIYLLIAGTYTPFTLVVLGGARGWTVLGVVWGLAVLGILYEVVWHRPWRWLSLASYLGLGWLLLVVVKQVVAALPTGGLLLLAASGVAYTGGTVFYAWRAFPYHHAVWHVFVLIGTACSFFCILWYVVPLA